MRQIRRCQTCSLLWLCSGSFSLLSFCFYSYKGLNVNSPLSLCKNNERLAFGTNLLLFTLKGKPNLD